MYEERETMSKRFVFRLRITVAVALVVLGLYALDGFTEGFYKAAHGAWAFCVTFSVFWGWFGLEEIWYAGRRMQAAMLGAALFFSELTNLMSVPSPGWSRVLIILIAAYAVLAAWHAVCRREAR
jgi:ribose/xylose/arabinose/galactoside ABC-type transport system permease subunit